MWFWKQAHPVIKGRPAAVWVWESVCFECGWKKRLDMKDLFYMIDCSDRYGTAYIYHNSLKWMFFDKQTSKREHPSSPVSRQESRTPAIYCCHENPHRVRAGTMFGFVPLFCSNFPACMVFPNCLPYFLKYYKNYSISFESKSLPLSNKDSNQKINPFSSGLGLCYSLPSCPEPTTASSKNP